MKHYLFVHFRETTSPEGEQVRFALSRDGFAWEALNGGRPILWAYAGDHGVRDMTIVRDGHTVHILARPVRAFVGEHPPARQPGAGALAVGGSGALDGGGADSAGR